MAKASNSSRNLGTLTYDSDRTLSMRRQSSVILFKPAKCIVPLAMLVISSMSLTGCVRRVGRNSNCEWPVEPGAKALHLDDSKDARHLSSDLEFAEDLAVRYVDAHFGPRSGNYESRQVASQAMNSCMVKLGQSISESHNVPANALKDFFGRRNYVADFAINLPFFLLYWLISAVLAKKLLRSYPPHEGMVLVLAILALTSLAFGVAGMLLGQLWSIVAENLRVGTGHLSYRVGRLPSERHRMIFCLFCVLLFWSAVWARSKRRATQVDVSSSAG